MPNAGITPTRSPLFTAPAVAEPGVVPPPEMPVLTPDAESGNSGRRLLLFRRIAAPLLAAVAGWKPGEEAGEPDAADLAASLAALIDNTLIFNHEILARLGPDADDRARWLAAGASSEIVAAHYRATGRALSPEEASPMLDTMAEALSEKLSRAGAAEQPEEIFPGSLFGQMLKALAPAISAIARFSFGRDATDLLAEVTARLTAIALEATSRLNGLPPGDGKLTPLYYASLEIAGEFYRECHFAEMDRLLEMPPEERREYVRAHDRKIPMEPIWQALGLRMGMLETMARHLPAAGAGSELS